jgi:hypothetical protein
MRAFKLFLNGKKMCLAGVGDDGVLSTTLVYAPYRRRRHMEVRVGGLLMPQGEHVEWKKHALHVGDELRVKVVECESVDEPRKRHRRDPVQDAKNEKRYVRKLAKKLGWKIIRPGK